MPVLAEARGEMEAIWHPEDDATRRYTLGFSYSFPTSALVKKSALRMIRWQVQVRYPKSSDWEVIAIFDKELDANMYARTHNGEGRGVLRVISRDCEHL
jgi:hypothetical protein